MMLFVKEVGIGISGFGYFLARLFGFCVKKISVSWFWCSLRFADIS